ncbi:MAG: MarR family winged helix-turn-helix transcriptional regulator [Dermatophilaceae bacterium]
MSIDERTTQCLGDELVRLVKVLISMRQLAPAPHTHVDHTHFPVLFNLAAEPRRVSDLAGCVHADVSTVSRQVSHLVDHGLVAKAPDPHDGRVQILSLTDEGRRAIAAITAARGRWLRSVLADWSQPDAQQLLGHVTRFADSLESAKTALLPNGV